MVVHHRVPGRSVMSLMLPLCPACHGKIHRTKAVFPRYPASIGALARTASHGHEQVQLESNSNDPRQSPFHIQERQRSGLPDNTAPNAGLRL